ncbi:hypothetical protein QA596_07860 [Balneolales bacterium ANBcel1]|nr:hypothetical protein [Balneolales bacterium ANBcel1]
MNKSITFERKPLYEEVWSIPLTILAKKYGLSLHHMTQVCKKMNIPTPKAGHWSKVRYGKRTRLKPLPDSEITAFTYYFEPDIQLSDNDYPEITVSSRLTNPHHLVKITFDALKEQPTDNFNRLIPPLNAQTLDLVVSATSLKRSLRIVDSLIKNGISMGWEIGTTKEYYKRSNTSYFIIGLEKIYFRIMETVKRRKKKPEEKKYSFENDYWYEPTGKLKLILSGSVWQLDAKTISDNKGKTIEERLDRFFPIMLTMAERIKENRLQREENDRKREEEVKARKKREEEWQIELNKRSNLEKQASLFTKSHYIYQFIDEIRSCKESLSLKHNESQALDAWIMWATEHADRLNPVNQVIKTITSPGDEDEQTVSRFMNLNP